MNLVPSLLVLPSQFSPMIRAARKRAGLTQAELGQRMGLSQKRISAVERDPASLSFDQLLKLCSLLGMELLLQPRKPKKADPSNKAPW